MYTVKCCVSNKNINNNHTSYSTFNNMSTTMSESELSTPQHSKQPYSTQIDIQQLQDIDDQLHNNDTIQSAQEIIVHESIRSLLRPAAAEFVGSAIFVFIACGAGMTTVRYQAIGNITIGIALSFGFTIFTLAFMIGHISGGHLNFAVTLTFCLLRMLHSQCYLYILLLAIVLITHTNICNSC